MERDSSPRGECGFVAKETRRGGKTGTGTEPVGAAPPSLLLLTAACGQSVAAERLHGRTDRHSGAYRGSSVADRRRDGRRKRIGAGPIHPVLLAAGDIAACSREGDSATAAILAQAPDARVQTLGDNAYDKGTPASSAASTTRGASRMTVCSPPWVGTTT